ncbi:unnamed protein product [Symbiodinium natans]|uniref:Uncharacterized protein n=1 Tax=Symbiodinium natans TaxID=878477 RepID=A0A812TLD4_9DINO|nr:unnamed protein product [Symbiodinium natans]
MFLLENHVDPLFRPPLALAVLAAAIKVLTTAWVMDEPLLKTNGALKQEGDAPLKTKVTRLVLRMLFLAMATNTLVEDAQMAMSSLAQLRGFQKLHALALVLAFSPNTLAAVAVSWMIEVKLSWTHQFFLQPNRLSIISDIMALVYIGMLHMVYVFPLFLFGTTHSVLGFCVLCYAFAYDLCTLPWRLASGDMADIWIAVPVFFAGVFLFMLYGGVMLCYFFLMRGRYPDVALRAKAQGHSEEKLFKEQMPHQVAARIIGAARDGGLAKQSATAELRELRWRTLETDPTLEREDEDDKCILNDDFLLLACAGKVLGCLSMPMVQLCVVIASQVYLGHGFWEAANASFQERTWAHYCEKMSRFAEQRPFSMLWMYV